ncbi:hypothetical protein BS17DRAFT_789471 [Gyrodon lividus]|nr:hypothetical protein BS17DRAFT_789471 [Gyrodon lividus]
MWSKISSALKPRQGSDNETDHPVAHTDVLSKVYEQHPNMSLFHDANPEVPLPTSSPPPSPSKKGRKGVLKRMSRTSKAEEVDSLRGQSPLKLPISLPKKVRSHMQLKSSDSLQPGTPLESKSDSKYGSVRSILRHPKTPGTGQNVRFFSRNACRSVSPDTSINSNPDPVSFADRLLNTKTDINDSSEAAVVYTNTDPDPFRADATTYYTLQTMIPPSPPQGTHSRTASREEDIMWSLRTQLALQQELCAQYEIDLGACDELVQALTTRLETAEKENEKRKGVLRSWKKKTAELEKVCRHLEEEVDNSRQESMERSIMDEASGEALRQLHRQISQLEREKSDVSAKEETIRTERDTLARSVKEKDDELSRLKEALKAPAAKLQAEKMSLISELVSVRDQLSRKDEDYLLLKSELGAQWQNTEKDGEHIEQMGKEGDASKGEIEALESKISTMEEEWNNSENRRSELEAELQDALGARDALEKEREELEDQLHQEREHADGLTQSMQEQEDRLSQLDEELRFMKENVARLEYNVKDRDAEIASLSEKVVERAAEAEKLHEQLSSLKREQARFGDVHKRELEDAVTRDRDAREQLETALREKATSDIALGSSKERLHSLSEEMSRLRVQIHQLQKESADKEVTIVHLNKQVAQDKEDINGLNIALDSKQQELELVKRKHGVRGTGGSTPAPSKIASRRESSTFSTPSAGRPPSALSDVSRDGLERKLGETPSVPPRVSIGALSRSVRMNAASSAAAKLVGGMGPPAAKISRPPAPGISTPIGPRALSALGKSPSARSSVAGTVTTAGNLRRASNSSVESQTKVTSRRISASSAPSEADEKENVSTPTSLKTPRRTRALA